MYARGPAMAVHGSTVYLGFMHAGLVVFDRDGVTTALNEDDGLAYNNIRHLECLGNKVFFHIGAARRHSGLMEPDLTTIIQEFLRQRE